jgi:hypothetical protein
VPFWGTHQAGRRNRRSDSEAGKASANPQYLDGDTAIAEWEAEFDEVIEGVRKHMKDIAVLTFEAT